MTPWTIRISVLRDGSAEMLLETSSGAVPIPQVGWQIEVSGTIVKVDKIQLDWPMQCVYVLCSECV